jgi:hypothetical protein
VNQEIQAFEEFSISEQMALLLLPWDRDDHVIFGEWEIK